MNPVEKPIPIIIPLHHGGGKLGDDTELKFALRSIERHFKHPFLIVIVGRKVPDWLVGVEHLACDKGLKTALRVAAEAFPEGFMWWYDDCTLLQDISLADAMLTPAMKNWCSARTAWAKELEKIRQRLVKEKIKVWDYSRPHGPYCFDKGMIDEAFADWPGMAGKFPFETWILCKRDWPRSFGKVKQYYGPFRNPPGESAVYLNYNDAGNTQELRSWLAQRFPEPSRFEKRLSSLDLPSRVSAVAVYLPGRPRWESACVEIMKAAGIDVKLFEGVDGHGLIQAPMYVNVGAFRQSFKRHPLPGEIGCFASHLGIAKIADSLPGLCGEMSDWRLVFEDDAVPVSMTSAQILHIAKMAEKSGYQIVMLHTGRKNRRGRGITRITRTTGSDVFTHAYLAHVSAFREMAGWEMRHPIDHAISKSKKLKVGVLWGASKFEQRSPASSSVSIHHERKACYQGKDFSPLSVEQKSSGISKKLHQVWVQGERELPDAYRENRRLWASALPEFELILWDEKSASEQWPDFAAVSARCFHHATRADLILARAIRDFGGLATGTDCRPNNPSKLLALMEVVEAFLVLTPGRQEISNGLQWSARAGHPFWSCVCNHQLRNSGAHLGRASVSSATGPKCYHHAFHARMWDLHLVTAPAAFTRDWKNAWKNPDALIDPGFAASWTK